MTGTTLGVDIGGTKLLMTLTHHANAVLHALAPPPTGLLHHAEVPTRTGDSYRTHQRREFGSRRRPSSAPARHVRS